MSRLKKVVVSSGFLFATLGAGIASASNVTSVTAAIKEGQDMMDLIAPGVIAMAAVMMGVTLVVSWLRK
jgi:hypothetical protein